MQIIENKYKYYIEPGMFQSQGPSFVLWKAHVDDCSVPYYTTRLPIILMIIHKNKDPIIFNAIKNKYYNNIIPEEEDIRYIKLILTLKNRKYVSVIEKLLTYKM